MFKAILVIAVVGVLGWLIYDRLDLEDTDVPPPVEYPMVNGGGGVGGVGDNTGGLLSP